MGRGTGVRVGLGSAGYPSHNRLRVSDFRQHEPVRAGIVQPGATCEAHAWTFDRSDLVVLGARGGVRTRMTRRSGGFKPPVSANFTTRAGARTQAIHSAPHTARARLQTSADVAGGVERGARIGRWRRTIDGNRRLRARSRNLRSALAWRACGPLASHWPSSRWWPSLRVARHPTVHSTPRRPDRQRACDLGRSVRHARRAPRAASIGGRATTRAPRTRRWSAPHSPCRSTTTTRPATPSTWPWFEFRRTGDRQGAVLFNPGGPGGSGFDLDRLQRHRDRDRLSASSRSISIGFDPRGVDRSGGIHCVHRRVPGQAPVRRRDAGHARGTGAEGRGARAGFIDGCKAKYGDTLRFYSTENTARDMDAIRAALGDEQISFLGVSYGTYLGATYATMFPDRVRAMVLDSVVRTERRHRRAGVQDPTGRFRGRVRQLDRVVPEATRLAISRPPMSEHGGMR